MQTNKYKKCCSFNFVRIFFVVLFFLSANGGQNSLSKCPSGEQVKPRKKHKSLTNEEFLISLKMKEKR